MDLLVFAVVVLVVVGIVCAISYYIPWPPPLAWARWALPALALLVALIVIVQRLNLVA
jgi:hypothetical protein